MIPDLDEAILSRPRLSILAALVSGDAVDFTFLQKNLGIADGNLSTHLRKLEAEEYIESEKVFVSRRPKTFYRVTSGGRSALQKLFGQLETMLSGSATAADSSPARQNAKNSSAGNGREKK
jgi:DNA-binding MarR family transcriptional regulator